MKPSPLLGAVRGEAQEARRHLQAGRVADAMVSWGYAQRMFGRVTARGSLEGEDEVARELVRLGAEIGLAAEPERVPAHVLRAELVVALSVLRQQGAQVTDEQIVERASNIAAGICGAYDVRQPRAPMTARSPQG